jgi:hypothetical protein
MRTSRTNLPILASYALVVVVAALSLATHDALTFRPGGEFGSPAASFVFTLVIWGVVALTLGTMPLILIFAALSGFGRLARLPWLVGALYGLLFVGGTGIGGTPFAASLAAAALVSPLVVVLAYRSRSADAPSA